MKYFNQSALLLLTLTLACSRPATSIKDSTTAIKEDREPSKMTAVKEVNMEKYTVKYGYMKYDEDLYGFSNPGFMTIFKDGTLIYTDSFKGEGSIDLKSLDYHNLDGKKLVFSLNYGTEACDYIYTSKYYVVINDRIHFFKECQSVTGGDLYSSKFYEPIFPNDSAGQPNSILIVEGQIFHEKDQPDRTDTTYITFANNHFTITKPTDNLSKVK